NGQTCFLFGARGHDRQRGGFGGRRRNGDCCGLGSGGCRLLGGGFLADSCRWCCIWGIQRHDVGRGCNHGTHAGRQLGKRHKRCAPVVRVTGLAFATPVYWISRTACRTSSTWPGTRTPRHSRSRVPSASIRNVLRSMPRTCLPYMFFIFMTPNNWHKVSSGSDIKGKGRSCLSVKFVCDLSESR